jgi:hypothetical protein
MIAVPELTPYTTPVAEPTVATAVLALVHVPDPEGSLKVVVSEVHTLVKPEIGKGFTVKVVVVVQPVFKV